jgi:hypothetical protein
MANFLISLNALLMDTNPNTKILTKKTKDSISIPYEDFLQSGISTRIEKNELNKALNIAIEHTNRVGLQ